MVKNSKKPKNHIQPPTLPPRQANKYTGTKSSKKSEKSKAFTTTTTKVLPKSKAQHVQASQQTDADPCTSKQAIVIAAGNVIRPKSPSKLPWGGIWKRIDKKKDLSTLTSRKHIRPPRKLSPMPEPTSSTTTPTSPPRQTPELPPAEDTSTFEETKIASLLQSGIIRYSDVVRSKNVSSSASLKPPPIIKLPPSSLPIGNSTNEAAAIDLEYFPELGQHKTWQSPTATSSSRFSRKPTSVGSDEKTALLCLPESPNLKSESSETNRKESTPNEDLATNVTNSQASPLCHQCQLNAQWLERVIQNSAKPFHINVPEFNFLQPDIAYPRFLMQFEDENYLKAEKMALLGLKLALGGNFHRQHAN